jgi:hypothetical protein
MMKEMPGTRCLVVVVLLLLFCAFASGYFVRGCFKTAYEQAIEAANRAKEYDREMLEEYKKQGYYKNDINRHGTVIQTWIIDQNGKRLVDERQIMTGGAGKE